MSDIPQFARREGMGVDEDGEEEEHEEDEHIRVTSRGRQHRDEGVEGREEEGDEEEHGGAGQAGEEEMEEEVGCYFEVPTSLEDFTVGQERNPTEWVRRRLLMMGCKRTARAIAPHVSTEFIKALAWSFRMAVAVTLASFFVLYRPVGAFFGCTYPACLQQL